MAALIPSPGMGVWSREYPVFCNAVCLFGFIGVSREPGVMTSAVWTVPRLVRFSVHATRWYFGEVECSCIRFCDIAVREDSGVQEQLLGSLW
jgi:hypothetical protein